MTDNQFDDIIRKRLESHESVVPADMLERITENDKGRKRGYVPRWYILIFLLLLTGIIITYFFVSKSGNSTLDENAVVSKKSLNDEAGEGKEKNSSQNILSPALKNNNPNSNDANEQIQDRALTSAKNNIKRASKNTPPSYDDKTFSPGTQHGNELKSINDKNIFQDSLAPISKPGMSLQKDSGASAVAEIDEEENIPGKFSLELYASPVMPFNNISSASSNYEQVLKHASAMRLSYTIGARLDFAASKKFGVKIGVQYTQVNEKMTFTDSVLSENQVSKNRYKFIDIPVLVSYKTAWPGYFHTSVNTGILVNIATRYKGLVPGSSGGSIDMGDASVYYRNTGISVYLSIALSKEINNRISIFSEPYFRYHVKNMANNFQLFDQKIHTAGISLGLKYNLSKKVND